ncbi:MAG: prenyltransferase [Candidatus Methanosuratincola sp.]|jgi:1,4-dihydroxy-2-naphthoate octaprenyltransferase|nr:prenyltransferase [Candidatus Methanosuratincola sp.]
MFVKTTVGAAGQKSRAWLLLKLSRPHFLVPGALLYTMGAIVAQLRWSACPLDRMIFGYSIFFFAHLSVSFSNDYHDRESDRIAGRTFFSGGSGVLLEHRDLEKAALRIAQALLLSSFVAALLFTITYGFSYAFLAFALAGGFLGWFYSAPPLKLSYRGLGEVATALAAGLIMPGTGYFVVSGQLDTWFAVLSIPLIFYGLYFILTVEIPDFEADRAAKKMNVVTRIGVKKASFVSLTASISGTGMLVALHFLGFAGGAFDLSKLAIISLLPFATAAASLVGSMTGNLSAVRQTAMNMSGLVGFLSASVLVLYFELVPG